MHEASRDIFLGRDRYSPHPWKARSGAIVRGAGESPAGTQWMQWLTNVIMVQALLHMYKA